MKKILKKEIKEVCEYRSDFTGSPFSLGIPPVKVIFDFGYGSRYDGEALELHLSEEESLEVLDFLAGRLCQESRKHLIESTLNAGGGGEGGGGGIKGRSYREQG